MEPLRKCRVCEKNQADGAHFGVDSCRACAAFFRRSVVTDRKYVCRQGSNDCHYATTPGSANKKDVRYFCRQCRYRRCMEVGMLAEAVVKKRKPIEERPSSSNDQQSSEVERSASSVEASGSRNQGENRQRESAESTSYPAKLEPTGVRLLWRVDENYRSFCARRKNAEDIIVRSTLGMFAAPEKPVESNFDTVSKIMRVVVPDIAEFLSTTFEEFNQLDQSEKWLIFKAFVQHLWIFESTCFTLAVQPNWGAAGFDNLWMVTQTTYMLRSNCAAFIGTTNINTSSLAKLMEQSIGKREALTILIRDLALSPVEFAACISLLLWNPNYSDVDAKDRNVMVLAKQQRNRIFNELHEHYRNQLGMENYAERIGELLSMLCAVQWCNTYMREDIELFKLFSLFDNDTFLYDLWKC